MKKIPLITNNTGNFFRKKSLWINNNRIMVNTIEWLQTSLRQNVKWRKKLSELTKLYPIIDTLQRKWGYFDGKKQVTVANLTCNKLSYLI
jgi:hypothetical protein